MRDLKGVVLEVSGGTMLVLNEDGELQTLSAPANPPATGTVVYLPEEVPTRSWSLLRLAAAAALFVLSLGFGGWQYWAHQTIAVVGIDINPSLQLELDRRGAVRQVIALNEDGRHLVGGIDLTGVALNEALVAVVDRSKAMGYIRLNQEALVVVTLVPMKKGISFGTSEIRSLLDSQVTGSVVVMEAPVEVVAEAREAGVSLSKVMVRRALLKQGIDVPIETLKAQSIPQALSTVGVQPGALLNPALAPQLSPEQGTQAQQSNQTQPATQTQESSSDEEEEED